MSTKKIISINPDYLSGSGSSLVKRKNRKTRKSKPIVPKKFKNETNNCKKQLIKRFAEHKRKKDLIKMKNEIEKEEEFETSYKEAIDFLQNKLQKRSQRRKKEKIKNYNKNIDEDRIRNALNRVNRNEDIENNFNINTEKPAIFHNEMNSMENINNTNERESDLYNKRKESKYGILKGGRLPLFSQRKKKLNNFIKNYKNGDYDKPIDNINTFNNVDDVDDSITNSFNNPNLKIDIQAKKSIKEHQLKNKLKKNQVIRKKKTYKRKIKLGKKGDRVSVLIKNNKTRRKVKNEHRKLKIKPIDEIKRYLRRHNLIKMGSSAPENILREIYETSFLSGEVYNTNKDVLMHNYMLDEETI